jgi:hypothetical protein
VGSETPDSIPDGELARRLSPLWRLSLPVVLALLVVNLARSRSLAGAVIRADIVFLLILAPAFGEGSICLIMASPLFLAVSLIGVALFKLTRGATTAAIAVLPLRLGFPLPTAYDHHGDAAEIRFASGPRPRGSWVVNVAET